MNKRLTATEAAKLAENNDSVKAVDEIIEGVKLAATLGKRSYITRSYEFGSGKCYCSEKDYPEICKAILKELRDLGYHCSVRCKEGQFVDLWLEVQW